MISSEKHASFFEWQLKLQEENWLAYAGGRMKDLLAAGKLFAGRIWGIQASNGMAILRFRRGEEPRMKAPWLLCLAGDTGGLPPSEWGFTYRSYRLSESPRYSGKNTEVKTQYYLRVENDSWSYIAVSGFDAGLLEEISDAYLFEGQHPLITLSLTDPPVEFLISLRKFVAGRDVFQNIDLSRPAGRYAPRSLAGSAQIPALPAAALNDENTVMVQGPPGTGKSYMAAEMVAGYLLQGKNVIITALTNHSLAEIAGQPPLRDLLKAGRLYKSSLSADEQKQLRGLRAFTGALPGPGELLLISSYQLAVLYEQTTGKVPVADLLVIEEASQAFLAAIVMFAMLGRQVLIIGDHMQLPPIVINRHDAVKVLQEADTVIDGFSVMIRTSDHPAFLLTETRRLAPEAAALTGLYYPAELVSLAPPVSNVANDNSFLTLFHPEGGITKALYPLNAATTDNQNIIDLFCRTAAELLSLDPETAVALLTPYASAETALYRAYSKIGAENQRLTISTVHKVQGITTSFTLLYLPLDNPSFELDDQLFNVGTSRALRGTLIIAPVHLDLVMNISPATMAFIERAINVSANFIELLNHPNE